MARPTFGAFDPVLGPGPGGGPGWYLKLLHLGDDQVGAVGAVSECVRATRSTAAEISLLLKGANRVAAATGGMCRRARRRAQWPAPRCARGGVYRRGIPGLGSSTLGALRLLAAGQYHQRRRTVRHPGEGKLDAYGEGDRTGDGLVVLVGDPCDLANPFPARWSRGIDGERSGSDPHGSSVAGRPFEAAAALGSSGYVVESVPLALWLGFGSWSSAVEALERAALVADDADTVASLVGHLLGAAGYEAPVGPVELDLPNLHEIAAGIAAARFDTADQT